MKTKSFIHKDHKWIPNPKPYQIHISKNGKRYFEFDLNKFRYKENK